MCVIPAGGLQVQNEAWASSKTRFQKTETTKLTHKQNLNVLRLRARGDALAQPPATVGMSSDIRKHLGATAALLSGGKVLLARGGPVYAIHEGF